MEHDGEENEMKTNKKLYSILIASSSLILFLFSFAVSAASVQSAPSATQYAYLPNPTDNTVSVVDMSANTVTYLVPVEEYPLGVAVNPEGTTVFVTNQNSSTVSVIDTSTNNVTANVTVGNDPHGVAVNSDGTKVYVANRLSQSVSVIETATNTVSMVPVGNGSVGVAVTPDGKKAYVTNYDDNTISVIDTATNTVSMVPVEKGPRGVAVSPDGKKVYVTNYYGNSVSVIDTITNTVTDTVPVGKGPFGVAITPDGTKVYVTNYYGNSVSVIDTITNTVMSPSVAVGIYPYGVEVTPDGTKVYVTNYQSNSVSVIDTATNTVTSTVPVGSRPIAFGHFIITRPLSVLNTTTNLKPPDNEILFEHSIKFVATVDTKSQGTYTPSGKVIFIDGTTPIGIEILNDRREATMYTTSLSIGSHSITAKYSGDSNFKSSTSSAITIKIVKSPTSFWGKMKERPNIIIEAFVTNAVGKGLYEIIMKGIPIMKEQLPNIEKYIKELIKAPIPKLMLS